MGDHPPNKMYDLLPLNQNDLHIYKVTLCFLFHFLFEHTLFELSQNLPFKGQEHFVLPTKIITKLSPQDNF